MQILWISFVSIIMTSFCFASNAHTENHPAQQKYNTTFFTSRDLTSPSPLSNLTLKNDGNTSVVVYSVYIRQFASVPAGQTCSSPIVLAPDPTTLNVASGAVVAPVTIRPHSEAVIGANYLYNMIYGTIYYASLQGALPPENCALPGCTWGSDSTSYNWCIFLGALAPVSVSADYTSTIPPFGEEVSGADYNYSLVSNYAYLGAISCDDQTLTCHAATLQTQSFSG